MGDDQYQEHIGAFADGELDPAAYAEAYEHLLNDPACAEKVAEIRQLKQAVARVLSADQPPEGLAARVQAALNEEAVTSGGTIPVDTSTGGRVGGRSILRYGRWLAIAAVVVFCVGVWQTRTDSRTVIRGAVQSAAAAVVEQHELCIREHGFDHHDESLSRELPVVADRLASRLGFAVLVPNLSADGFEFVGADRCGIREHPGAHALYHSEEQDFLSVFTVAHMTDLDVPCGRRVGEHEYVIVVDERAGVVAWQDGGSTYAVCGSGMISESDLLALVDRDIRVAVLESAPGLVVASVGR